MSDKGVVEKVLCVSRSELPREWLGEASAVPVREVDFYSRMAGETYAWLPRPQAETKPEWKQIIPYVVVQSREDSLIVTYRRVGSEKRLHDLWSVGIGGHINPEDQLSCTDALDAVVKKGVSRELAEELGDSGNGYDLEFLGVINEERTEVGRVHFGLVFLVKTDAGDISRASEELADCGWMEKQQVKELKLELWSELAMDLVLNR